MSESVVAPFVGMVRHSQVAMEYGTSGIHAQSSLEVVFRQGVLLLAVVDGPEAVPRIVMPPVEPHRVAVHGHGFFEGLIRDVLVAAQRVRVGEPRGYGDSSMKASDGRVVLLL